MFLSKMLCMLLSAALVAACSAMDLKAFHKASDELKRGKPSVPKRVVVVTGASSGIGKAIALEFARYPEYKVWATMRDPSKWDSGEVEDSLRVGSLDVTSDESVNELINRVVAEDGGIDVLINNAGFGLSGCLEMVQIAEARALFDVNLWGVVRMLQAVLPHMRQARQGHVINISSTSGIRGIPCFEFYTSSKFALEGLTDSMRYSLAAFNIAVTNINAGPVVTRFTDRFGNAETGGKGTRDPLDNTGYLEGLNQMMIDSLTARMASAEAQKPEQVAVIVHHLVTMKFDGSGRPTDVPFNMGTSLESQKVLEDVRLNPTGWGGIYSKLLAHVPPLVDPALPREAVGSAQPNEEL